MPTNLELYVSLDDLADENAFQTKVRSHFNFNSLLNKLTFEDNIDSADLGDDETDDEIVANISRCFETFSQLQSFTYNTIWGSVPVIDEIAHFLSVSPTLRTFRISVNDSAVIGIDAFLSKVLSNGHIEKVFVHLEKLILEDISSLFSALHRLPRLRKFTLSGALPDDQKVLVTEFVLNGLVDIGQNQPCLSDLVIESVPFKGRELARIFKALPLVMNKVVLTCDPIDRDLKKALQLQLFTFPYIEHLTVQNIQVSQDFKEKLLPKFTSLARAHTTTFFPINWDNALWESSSALSPSNFKSGVFSWATIQKFITSYSADDLFTRYSKAMQTGKLQYGLKVPEAFIRPLRGITSVNIQRITKTLIQLATVNPGLESICLSYTRDDMVSNTFYPLNLFPYLRNFTLEGHLSSPRMESNFDHAMHTLRSLRRIELVRTEMPWDVLVQILKTNIQLEEVALTFATLSRIPSQDLKHLVSMTKSMINLRVLTVLSFTLQGSWPDEYQHSFISSSLQHLNVSLTEDANIPKDDPQWWKSLYPNLQLIEALPIIEHLYDVVSTSKQSLIPLPLPHQKVKHVREYTPVITMKGEILPIPNIWTALDISFVRLDTLRELSNGDVSVSISISDSRIQNLTSLRSLNLSHLTLKNVGLTPRLFAQIFAEKEYPKLTHLNISDNSTFSTLGIQTKPFLHLGFNLTNLDISGCCIGSGQLTRFLPHYSKLESLSLARNFLSSPEDISALTVYLQSNSRLSSLNINQCFEDINPILDILSHPPFTLLSLQANSIYGPHFDPTSLRALIQANTYIQELSLIHVSPHPEELEAMFSNINSPSLHHLFFVQKRNLIQIRNKEKNEIPSTLEGSRKIKRTRT